jgi:hypothetical protein
MSQNQSVEDATEAISGAFNQWLAGEVESSNSDRNDYLDNFQEWRSQIRLGYANHGNWTAEKNRAHLNRLPIWWQGFEMDPSNDEQSAKILFAGLMFVSGAYRNQCYFQAESAEDYESRRRAAVGINIENAISTRLNTHLPSTGNFANARISVEDLNQRRIASEKIGETAVKAICARGQIGYDFGQERSRSVVEMANAQYNWLTFSVDCVTLAAKIRKGELEAVPFLHPINITDNPGVYYPLAGERPIVRVE